MHLFWPDTVDELDFIDEAFSGESFRHIGYRSYHPDEGIIHSDYSIGVGIPFVTTDKNGDSIISLTQSYNLDLTECLVFSASSKKLEVKTPCIPAKAICKTMLGTVKHIHT